AYISNGTLLVGDLVSFTAAFTVGKTNVAADMQKFAGVVVGGQALDFRVMQDDNAVGFTAALVNQIVLVGYQGKFKVVSDAAIVALANLSQGVVTAGRADDAGATQGQIVGLALEVAAGAGVKILALISHR